MRKLIFALIFFAVMINGINCRDEYYKKAEIKKMMCKCKMNYYCAHWDENGRCKNFGKPNVYNGYFYYLCPEHEKDRRNFK